MPIRPRRRLFISGLALMASLAAVALGWACLPTSAAAAAPRKADAACRDQGDERVRVAKVDERLDIALEDGRVLHLAGIDPRRPTPDTPEGDLAARDELTARIGGAEIDFVPLADKPDRWGRIVVLAFFAEPQGNERSITAFLLERGLARLRPQPEIHACRAAWLAAEAQARAAALGLWADPYYAIIAADDRSAFAEKAATDVIVEGRLKAAVTGKAGLRLAFESRRDAAKSQNFSVIILQRNLRIFDQANMKFEPLIGHDLRVRGLLDMRFGPQIEIAGPDEIEVVDGTDGKAQLEMRATNSDMVPKNPPKDP